MERICIDTLHSCLQLPLNARAARKSDGRKTVSVRHPCLSLWERWPSCSEDGEGQITATSIGKCWHLRRQMTSRGRKALSVTCGDSSPQRESQGIVYWHKKWSVSVSIRSIHCLRLPLNARAARKSDGRKTVSVPAPLASPCGRGGRKRSEDGEGQITATSNRKMLAPSQADDVPRAQGPLSHLR